jgi:hypothetical protein
MLRYRVACDENGRHFVLPAFLEVVSTTETYATRATAQETADWLNGMRTSMVVVEADMGTVEKLTVSARPGTC